MHNGSDGSRERRVAYGWDDVCVMQLFSAEPPDRKIMTRLMHDEVTGVIVITGVSALNTIWRKTGKRMRLNMSTLSNPSILPFVADSSTNETSETGQANYVGGDSSFVTFLGIINIVWGINQGLNSTEFRYI